MCQGYTWHDKDAPLVAGFEGQLDYVVLPREIMADGEVQMLERLKFFKTVVKEVDG